LFTFNDGSKSSVQVLLSLGNHFLKTLHQRQTALIDMEIDDPLIDMEPKDMIDLIRVYSVLTKD
jgi:hypothetical protein